MQRGIAFAIKNKQLKTNSAPGGRITAKQISSLAAEAIFCYDDLVTGHWHSWLARFHGMEEVIGSNPICSTKVIY
jgi:hypothetical protein